MIRYFLMKGLLMAYSVSLLADTSSFTKQHNQEVLKQLPFDNKDDIEETSKGFVAPLPEIGVIKNAKGEIV